MIAIKLKYLQLVAVVFLILTQTAFLFIQQDITNYTVLFITTSVIYLIFIFSLLQSDVSIKKLYSLLFLFFLLKILFINIEPIGSDDYYRYLWDGKVQLNGINPYQFAPNDSSLNHLHSDLLPEKVSYPTIKTIYFPFSQWIFSLSYKLTGENAIGLKIFYLFSELTIIVSLLFLLKKFSINQKHILIYAALPLITFQFFIDAHIDIVGVSLLILSVTLYFYNRKFLSYILLGLSVSVKPTGFLMIPFLFKYEVGLKDKVKSLLVPVLVFIITFIPYIFTATPLDTLINYSVNWTFNGMIYNILNIFISDNHTIRIICGTFFFFVYVYLFFSKLELINKIYLSLFLLMIFSPVVHPWYLIWFTVLLPVVRSYSGIYFVSAINLTFITVVTYQTEGIWRESSYILLVEYLPILIFFIYELLKQKYLRVTL